MNSNKELMQTEQQRHENGKLRLDNTVAHNCHGKLKNINNNKKKSFLKLQQHLLKFVNIY